MPLNDTTDNAPTFCAVRVALGTG
jgi:hypothetical protein